MSSETPIENQESQSVIFDGADHFERQEYEEGIRKARNALFFVGALMFVVDMVIVMINKDTYADGAIWVIVAIDVCILATFIGLGLWSKRKPYTALLAGLITFCAVQVGAMFLDPTNIYKGILVKILVITTLIAGIKKAKRLQELNRIAGY